MNVVYVPFKIQYIHVGKLNLGTTLTPSIVHVYPYNNNVRVTNNNKQLHNLYSILAKEQ